MQTYPPAAVRPASANHAQRTQPHTHYERRRPETTVLHTLVRENIDTFLAQVKTESGSALPHAVGGAGERAARFVTVVDVIASTWGVPVIE